MISCIKNYFTFVINEKNYTNSSFLFYRNAERNAFIKTFNNKIFQKIITTHIPHYDVKERNNTERTFT